MIKIAIVGTSKTLTHYEKNYAKEIIRYIFRHNSPCVLISGGAKGIDSLAEEIAGEMGIEKKIFLATHASWNDYKDRNVRIVDECDKLFCITTSRIITEKCYHCNADHQKTAGCWCVKRAKNLNKYTRIFLV